MTYVRLFLRYSFHRVIMMWWSMTMRRQSLFLATQRSLSLKKVTNKWELNYHRCIPLCFFSPIHLDIAITFFQSLLHFPTIVYAEVETRIEALRHLLLDKLLQTPSTLHDQKRYIRSLYYFSFCQSFFILSACLCHSYCNTLLVSLMPFCVIAYQNFMPGPLSSVCLLVFFECSINFSVICSPILFCLFLFFPFTLHFFFLFFPCILLSAHTCGFCQFIIVKTNLTGSQRPVFNHTATSFILLH